MPDKPYDGNNFIKTFNSLARHRHRHRYDIFRDFVTLSAISIHNGIMKNKVLEDEYLEIIRQYKKKEVSEFCKLLNILVDLLDSEPRDILGGLYMDLKLGNENNGQFFTPPDISLMIAKMTYGSQLEDIDQPFITLSEPACGAGGMVLAFVKVMLDHGHNPANKLWVQCIDVDRLAALMCYLQLSLWHIPAEVVIGNTLTMEVREVLYTPAHYMNGWERRLHERRAKELITQEPPQMPEANNLKSSVETPKSVFNGDDLQLDFDF